MYSSLQYVTPPANEPVDVALVRQHLRVDFEDDALLAFYAQAAREQVEMFLGRALITQTLKWVMADAPPPIGYPYVSPIAIIVPQWVTWPVFIRKPIEIPRSPVQQVNSVSWGPWGQVALINPSEYTIDQTEPTRIRLPMVATVGGGHVEVVFTAGYGDTGDAVPQGIKLGVLILTAFLYENRGDSGGEMPEAVHRLLWPYRLYTFAG